MPVISDTVSVMVGPPGLQYQQAVNGAVVNAYKASRFGGTVPVEGTVPPGGVDAGPVTSGPTFGAEGAFVLTVPTFEPYMVAITSGGVIGWKQCQPILLTTDIIPDANLPTDIGFLDVPNTWSAVQAFPDGSINWSKITGSPAYALDNAVVHLAGTETITGAKTFSTAATLTTRLATVPDNANLVTPLLRVTPASRAPFQLSEWSSGPQADSTYDHWVGLGFNADVHAGAITGSNITAGEPAWYMGFEDGWYDGTHEGAEWYISYWSPDHTSVQLFRPFYTRVLRDGNSSHSASTYMDIGTDGAGVFAITSGAFDTIAAVSTSANRANTALALAGTNSAAINFTLYGGASQWQLGWSAGAGFFSLYDYVNARTHVSYTAGGSNAGAMTEFASRIKVDGSAEFASTSLFDGDITLADGVKVHTGTTTGTKFANSVFEKIGFFGATPQGQPAVSGSRGGNAALTSLLVALSQLGLVSDGSSA